MKKKKNPRLRRTKMYLFCFPPEGTKMALKFLKKKTTKLKSFLREYSISLYLSPCPFIINMFGIAFETDDYYVFAQEYALAGDLFDIIPPQVLHVLHYSELAASHRWEKNGGKKYPSWRVSAKGGCQSASRLFDRESICSSGGCGSGGRTGLPLTRRLFPPVHVLKFPRERY